MSEVFMAQNIKCGGCASAIEEGLGKLEGVSSVSVGVASGQVTVEGTLERAALAAALAELGYPEV